MEKFICALVNCLALAGTVALLDGAEEKRQRELFVVMIEPKLLASEVAREVPGARETVFAAGRETEYGGLRYYDRAEFESLGLPWEAFLARARASADRFMETLEPEYERDERGVIEYAVLSSKNPRTCGVILGDAFRKRFRKTLGEELVVAIPDRFTVLVYPRLGGGYADIGPSVIQQYEDAVYPVSTELFLVDARGAVRVIGGFSRGRSRGELKGESANP